MKLVNVMASSLDGRIGSTKIEGDEARELAGLSSLSDQMHLRRQIEQCDAIIVGASSIRANQECLRHQGVDGVPPTWYIITQSEIPPDYNFWNQLDIPRVIISTSDIPIHGAGVVLKKVKKVTASVIYELAKSDNKQRCLLFGGGIINSWFYSAKLVDELVLTLAPKFVGKETAPYFVNPSLPHEVELSLLSSQVAENFVFLNYAVKN